jgi:hypothetical protein
VSRRRSPVLLLGAGAGEATCGILYLAGHLRRNGVEAFVRLFDDDVTEGEIVATLERLVAHVRPRLVGLSLKWFHHVARAQVMARALKAIDPTIEVVVGGNTASFYWKELSSWSCLDHVALGDGEGPMLALARGDEAPVNVVTRAADGTPTRKPLGYVQGSGSDEIHYSHFDEIFLSALDLASFSGWVAPGKGCGENCLYCGGTRGVQKQSFGRAKPFLRPEAAVQKDHLHIAPRTWQLRYDFSGSSAAFLESTWAGVDLSRHATTYFLWGKPAPELIDSLARTFERVFMVLDIGCFSQTQRLTQLKLGLLKPCPTDEELFAIIEASKRHRNLELEISGIAGLPFASLATLREERSLIERVLGLGCTIGYQRLESQPGALVTEHPGRFGMVSEATTFEQFLEFFRRRDAGDGSVPMLRFADARLEQAVARTSEDLETLVRERAAERRYVELEGGTRLRAASVSTSEVALGAWLGSWKVPAKVANERVTLVRSLDGTGLACAPTVSHRRFQDPTLQQGDEGAALLAVLAAFKRPTTVAAALKALRGSLDADSAMEVIEHLTTGRFLQPG